MKGKRHHCWLPRPMRSLYVVQCPKCGLWWISTMDYGWKLCRYMNHDR